MTPISVPAIPAPHARTPAPTRAGAAAGRNERARGAASVEQQAETPPVEQEVTPTEVAPIVAPAVPRGPSLFKRALLWVFARTRKPAGVGTPDRTRTAHARWRGYALGCYGLIVAMTLAGQLYSSNPLGAYVKVQRVDLPKSTLVLVRNDSPFPWHHVRIRLNGIYTHTRDEIGPGDSLPLDVDKMFAITDGVGRVLRRPTKDMPIESITVDCDRGHYETELR
jgi:hypothetical protein